MYVYVTTMRWVFLCSFAEATGEHPNVEFKNTRLLITENSLKLKNAWAQQKQRNTKQSRYFDASRMVNSVLDPSTDFILLHPISREDRLHSSVRGHSRRDVANSSMKNSAKIPVLYAHWGPLTDFNQFLYKAVRYPAV